MKSVQSRGRGFRRRQRVTNMAAAVERVEDRCLLAAITIKDVADNHLTNFQSREANLGGSEELQFYKSGDNLYRPLLDFNLSDIPNGALIENAKIRLWHSEGRYGNSAMDVTLYAISQSWDEGIGTDHNAPSDGSDWLHPRTADNWNTEGGDFNTSFNFGNGSNGIVGHYTIPEFTSEGWVDFNIKSLVQAWHDGSIPNHGVAFVITSGDGTEHAFESHDNGDLTRSPRLYVTYDDSNTNNPGKLGLSDTSLTIDEDAGTVAFTVNRTGGSDGIVKVSYDTIAGTAQGNSDYVPKSGTLTFQDGITTKTVQVSITDDTEIETLEQFTFRLRNPTNGATLGNKTTSVSITDNDGVAGETIVLGVEKDNHLTNFQNQAANLGARPTLQFYKAGSDVYRPIMSFNISDVRDAGTELLDARVELYRTAGLYNNAPMQVSIYALTESWEEGDGVDWFSASPGSDWLHAKTGENWTTPGGTFNTSYNFGNGANGVVSTTTIPSFSSEGWISFDVTALMRAWLDDDLPNRGLGFVIESGDFSEHQFVSGEGTSALRPKLIVNTQVPTNGPGELSVAPSLSVAEGIGDAVFRIERHGGTSGAVSVEYETIELTATPGQDYVYKSGTITFQDGEALKTVNVSVIDDGNEETDERFRFKIRNPVGTTLGHNYTTTTILDDDTSGSPGTISLNSSSYEIDEDNSPITVTLIRTGGSDGAATVDYATVAGTATAGEDFNHRSGTVQFADGQTTRTITIPILNDTNAEGAEFFSIAIDATTGASLGQPRTALIEIHDDEGPGSGSGNGLAGRYYADRNLDDLVYKRIDSTVDFDWGTGGPATVVPGDIFSVRWNGMIEPVYSEQYTFRTHSSDGIRVWVDGVRIIDEWNNHSPSFQTGTINLTAGVKVPVKIEYYDRRHTAVAQLSWSSASQPLEVVPQDRLYSEPTEPIVFADIRVAGDDEFRVWVNGDLVGSGGGQNSKLFEDVRFFEGENVIGVRGRNDSGQGAVYLDASMGEREVVTNGQWRVSLNSPSGWNDVGFDDSSWDNATDYGDVNVTPFGDKNGLNPSSAGRWIWSDANLASGDDQVFVRQVVFVSGGDVATPGFGSENVVTGLLQPTALDFAPDGSMYIAQKNGVVRLYKNGNLQSAPFIDLSDEVNDTYDRGLLGIAVHPDFLNNKPYVYLLYTYDPPEAQNNTGLAGPDGHGNRVSRLLRVTADAADNYNSIVPGSEVVLLGTNSTWANISNPDKNGTTDVSLPDSCGPDATLQNCIAQDSQSHTIGAVRFGPDGMLYLTSGDGTAYGRVDPRSDRVQNLDSLSGKLLRINPITGKAVSDNPFHNGNSNANRSKVYSYGLRNPFRFAIDPVSGEPYLGDVGWTTWEEINTGRGRNFGWPWYEGGDGQNLETGGYRDLPAADDFYNSNPDVTAPVWSRAHAAGVRAIVVGDFYTGDVYPDEFDGTLFYTDYGDQVIRAITLKPDGSIDSSRVVMGGAGLVVSMTMGEDGYLYYADILGNIGRFTYGDAVAATPGGNSNSNITLQNSSDAVVLVGTGNDDTFEFDASAPDVVSINGVAYPLNNTYETFEIDGGGGDDVLTIIGSNDQETVILREGYVSYRFGDTLLRGDNLSTITVNAVGGGEDTVKVFDSAGNDEFVGTGTSGTLTGPGFANSVTGFDRVRVYSNSGGADQAIVAGTSQADEFRGYHDYSRLIGTTYDIGIHDFASVRAQSGGGSDSAWFYDSAGHDTFSSSPDFAALNGNGFEIVASGFPQSHAVSADGGNDVAEFFDSGSDDTFTATPDTATMQLPGVTNTASGFGEAIGYSTAGDDDAFLYDSTGDETFTARQHTANMNGPGYVLRAEGFGFVKGFASSGDDVARIYGSDGDDLLEAFPGKSELRNDDVLLVARSFDIVHAYAEDGNDTAEFHDSGLDETFIGRPHVASMKSPEFHNRAYNFDSVYAWATTGTDTSSLYDSPGADVFNAKPEHVVLSGEGFFLKLFAFERNHAHANAGGDDRADLRDSPGNDRLELRQARADIKDTDGNTFHNLATGFERVRGFGTAGGTNELEHIDPSLDYVFTELGTWT